MSEVMAGTYTSTSQNHCRREHSGGCRAQESEASSHSFSIRRSVLKSLATSFGHPRTERATGHALRITAAQRKASAGISEEKIRRCGRWMSDEVLAYVRETLISVANLSNARTVHDHNYAASSSVGHSGSSLAAAAPPRTKLRKWPSLWAAQT